jgi:hypothetical protein
VKDDITSVLNSKTNVMMILLDLSSAFDTVSHEKLLSTLSNCIGLDGSALEWFRSYLDGRQQCVKVGESSSADVPLTRSVPQGSVLGPLLFTVYTLPLGEIIRKHGINVHFYADDTQLYASFQKESSADIMRRMESCIEDLRIWMTRNCLQQNDTKTEVMVFSSPRSVAPEDADQSRLRCNRPLTQSPQPWCRVRRQAQHERVCVEDMCSLLWSPA